MSRASRQTASSPATQASRRKVSGVASVTVAITTVVDSVADAIPPDAGITAGPVQTQGVPQRSA